MAALDPRIEAIRTKYSLAANDFWELPQKKGTWLAKHAALEVVAAKAKIEFLAPQVLEADGTNKCVALCVTGSLEDRAEWSIGEASPANNRNAYPYAMAEKRGKDRVILKLIGLHGLVYSEDEADDFKAPATNGNGQSQRDAIHTPNTMPQDDDVVQGTLNWVRDQKAGINATIENQGGMDAIQAWLDKHGGSFDKPKSGSSLDRLKRKFPEAFRDLHNHYITKLNEV